MRIAVIGDYESSQYADMLQRVKIIFPGENVLNLSCFTGDWKKKADARLEAIFSSHLVIICADWDRFTDAKIDITRAQKFNKECLINIDGRFLSFPEYGRKW